MRYYHYLAWWFICIPFGHAFKYKTSSMAAECDRCNRYWGISLDYGDAEL